MGFSEDIFSGLHHFRSYPLRTSLTLLGIVIGAASVVAMIGIGEGTRVKIIHDMEKLGGTGLIAVQNDVQRVNMSRGTEGTWRLTWTDYTAIRRASNLIRKSAAVAEINARFSAGNRHASGPCLGVTTGFFGMRDWDVESGRTVHDIDVRNSARVCVLGSDMRNQLFLQGVDPIGTSIRIGPTEEFTVVGVMSEHQVEGAQWMNSQVFTPITTFQTRVAGNDYLERILLKADEINDVPLIVEQVRRVLRMNHDNPQWFSIYSQTKVINVVKSSTRLLRFSFGAIAVIVLIIGGIGIMNLMLVSVTERTREIGVRKAIGARNADIFLQFLFESLMLTSLGGVVGILVGMKTGDMFSLLVGEYLGDRVTSIVTAETLSLSAASVLIVGVVFGLYPALRAARLDPSEAIGYE